MCLTFDLDFRNKELAVDENLCVTIIIEKDFEDDTQFPAVLLDVSQVFNRMAGIGASPIKCANYYQPTIVSYWTSLSV